MGVPPGLHGTERLLEIARRAGASRYLNAPGGRELYRSADFSAAGVELRFLRPYDGPAQSILPRLLIESPAAVREEILARCDLEA
jgi:hypothetical protein